MRRHVEMLAGDIENAANASLTAKTPRFHGSIGSLLASNSATASGSSAAGRVAQAPSCSSTSNNRKGRMLDFRVNEAGKGMVWRYLAAK